jgi:hypothetical protein
MLFQNADVKVQNVAVSSPASVAANVPFNVTATATVHNNGPFGPVNVDTTVTLNLPNDCSTFITQVTFQDGSLGVSVAATVPLITYSVTCAEPSFHNFTATAMIAVDDPGAIDPTPGNNTLTSPASTTIVTKTADFKVAGVTVAGPPSATTSVPFNVTVDATLHNNGPDAASADATITLAAPPDCSAPANPRTVLGIALPVSAATALPTQTFSVTCSDKSFHDFSADVALSPPLHVTDPDGGNNATTGGPLTVPVIGPADVKVSSVSVGGPPQAFANTPFNVTTTLTAHNNGSFGPANTDLSATLTLPPDCSTTDPNPATAQDVPLPVSTSTPVGVSWSVTCTNQSFHSFSASGSITVDDLHVTDPNGANNSAQSAPAQVVVFAQADGKIVSATVLNPPFAIAANTSMNITVRKVLHNNGPLASASFNLSKSAIVPAGCTATPPPLSSHTLTASTATTVDEVWTISCSAIGTVTFTFSNTLTVTGLHIADPNTGNNSRSVSLTVLVDTDGDGIADGVETVCGSDPNNGNSIPERIDNAFALTDDDGDGMLNEALPAAAINTDCDTDGYPGSLEISVYGGSTTRDQDPCGFDGWPSDLFSSGISLNRLSLQDITSFSAPPPPKFGSSPPGPPFDVRWDLLPGPGALGPAHINLQDVTALVTGPRDRPPMLGGARAYDGPPCPWPP